ncbi:O-antigen ligase family protein [Ihubacter massiliensis]|uniref:O-antigen ligase family protein n=1 Tax=Ihubacter massiliensis TaxID=1852367 RepID=UPI00209713E3|nr:O-antigen ligase family protein [Ihubacter massiliensis]MCO7123751.1 O-antigen ligase family protein [Ihubacter massiliensis]
MFNSITFNKRIGQHIIYLYPLLFIMGTIINIILGVFPGLQNDTQSRIAIGGYIIIAIIIGLNFINVLMHTEKKLRLFIIVILISLIGMAPFILGLLFNGELFIYEILFKYILFEIPMCLLASCIIVEQKITSFILSFKWYGVIVIPFCVFYIGRILLADDVSLDYINFKSVNYMSIAYMLMPVIVCLLIETVFLNRRHALAKLALMLLLWVTLLFTGTRGAVLCVFFCIGMAILYEIIWNSCRNVKPIISILLIMILSYCFFVFIWSPQSSGANYRLNGFSREITKYDFDENNKVTLNLPNQNGKKVEKNSSVLDCYLNYMVESSNKGAISIREIKNGQAEFLKYMNKEERESVQQYEFIPNRMELFKLAFKEAKKHLIVGNGLFYFQNKYETYPHNMILEYLCDFGIIGASVFVLIVIGLMVQLIRKVKFKNDLLPALLFILSYIPQFMISGTIYFNPIAMFAISYAIIYLFYNKDENTIKR